MIGLCGAHRTGKSTVARELAKVMGYPTLLSDDYRVADALKINPVGEITLADRITYQEALLDAFMAAAREIGGPFISDRTPLDMAAYMMAAWDGKGTEEESSRVMAYIQRCTDMTAFHFSQVIYFPIDIPYVVAEGKPKPDLVYQRLIDVMILGLFMDTPVTVPTLLEPGNNTVEGRVSYILYAHRLGQSRMPARPVIVDRFGFATEQDVN